MLVWPCKSVSCIFRNSIRICSFGSDTGLVKEFARVWLGHRFHSTYAVLETESYSCDSQSWIVHNAPDLSVFMTEIGGLWQLPLSQFLSARLLFVITAMSFTRACVGFLLSDCFYNHSWTLSTVWLSHPCHTRWRGVQLFGEIHSTHVELTSR